MIAGRAAAARLEFPAFATINPFAPAPERVPSRAPANACGGRDPFAETVTRAGRFEFLNRIGAK